MRIDLCEIANNAGMTAKLDIEEKCPEDAGFSCTGPVKGELSFTNTGTLLIIMGRVRTEVKLECGRCLIDFTMPVESDVEEEFRVEKVGDTMQILPLEEEEQTSDIVKDNILDVHELVRQSLLVNLPIQPLCRPECMGLCPTCGENLNMRQCQCPPMEPESPFKALAELMEEEQEETE